MGEIVIINGDRLCRCGSIKSPDALMCQKCWRKKEQWFADEKAYLLSLSRRTCPECGSPKSYAAETCRNCYNKKIHKGDSDYGKELCPTCKKHLKSKAAKQCRKCHLKEQREKRYDNAEEHLHRPFYGEPRLYRQYARQEVHLGDERAGAAAEAVACTVGG